MKAQQRRTNEPTIEHIVFASHSSQIAGAERSMVATVRAANHQQVRVTVALPQPGPILGLLQGIDGVEVKFLKAQWWMGSDHRGWRGALKVIQSLVQSLWWWIAILRIRPTAVYVVSTVTPAPMLAAKLSRVPLVVFLSETIQTNPSLESILPKSLIVRCVTSWADVTVARSKYAADQYGGATLIEPSDIYDPHADYADRPDRSIHLQKLVMLGTLSPEKGQFDAVKAIAIARKAGAHLTLDFYGQAESGELAKLNSLIESEDLLGLVQHRGVTPTPLDILRSADLSLVCSRNEAYGRVTVESISVGTPVLGYRAGGTAEILEEGGGLAIDPSIEALADALVSLNADYAKFEALVRAAGERQRQKHFGSADRTVSRIRAALAIKG